MRTPIHPAARSARLLVAFVRWPGRDYDRILTGPPRDTERSCHAPEGAGQPTARRRHLSPEARLSRHDRSLWAGLQKQVADRALAGGSPSSSVESWTTCEPGASPLFAIGWTTTADSGGCFKEAVGVSATPRWLLSAGALGRRPSARAPRRRPALDAVDGWRPDVAALDRRVLAALWAAPQERRRDPRRPRRRRARPSRALGVRHLTIPPPGLRRQRSCSGSASYHGIAFGIAERVLRAPCYTCRRARRTIYWIVTDLGSPERARDRRPRGLRLGPFPSLGRWRRQLRAAAEVVAAVAPGGRDPRGRPGSGDAALVERDARRDVQREAATGAIVADLGADDPRRPPLGTARTRVTARSRRRATAAVSGASAGPAPRQPSSEEDRQQAPFPQAQQPEARPQHRASAAQAGADDGRRRASGPRPGGPPRRRA